MLDDASWKELERCIACSRGGCPVMGTASTMKSVSEMIGMMLPGTSSIPAGHASRQEAAEQTGKRIVEMVRAQLTPSRLLTASSFDNAIRLLAALGGSTNAVLHITAIAGRLGIRIGLEKYALLSANIPLLVNLQPSGQWNMDDFFEAGGLQGVIARLLPELDTGCLTALGLTIGEVYGEHCPVYREEVIATLDNPVTRQTGIKVLTGNLAPQGAILKLSASDARLHKHTGKAIVFDDYEAMLEQLDDPEFEADADSVLVLRYCGPVAKGMPEWGEIPLPKRLLQQGVRDMVRISDARMSGTSYGTVILHVSPEAAVGGPLAWLRSGDRVAVDVERGVLALEVDEAELERRKREWSPAASTNRDHPRGYIRLAAEHMLQADEGCDFDFLRPGANERPRLIPPIVGRG
jgi:dihydroxy-acid dehydratase